VLEVLLLVVVSAYVLSPRTLNEVLLFIELNAVKSSGGGQKRGLYRSSLPRSPAKSRGVRGRDARNRHRSQPVRIIRLRFCNHPLLFNDVRALTPTASAFSGIP
jgi:hypothetical protein